MIYDPFVREIGVLDTLISSVGSGSPRFQALALEYVQNHIRALGETDADLISVWIDAATSYFFEQTGRSPLTQTRQLLLDAFPFVGAPGMCARIELPHPPLRQVLTVKYIDANGVLQSLTGGSPVANLFTYTAPAGDYATPGFVEPLYGTAWPIARAQTASVQITYTCGYSDTPDGVPPLVRNILCLLVAHFDTFRSAVHEARRGQVLELPYGVEYMMDAFKFTAMSSQVLRRYQPFGYGFTGYGGTFQWP